MNSAAGILFATPLPQPAVRGGQAGAGGPAKRFDTELLALLSVLAPQVPTGALVGDPTAVSQGVQASGAVGAAPVVVVAGDLAVAGPRSVAAPLTAVPVAVPHGASGAPTTAPGVVAVAPASQPAPADPATGAQSTALQGAGPEGKALASTASLGQGAEGAGGASLPAAPALGALAWAQREARAEGPVERGVTAPSKAPLAAAARAETAAAVPPEARLAAGQGEAARRQGAATTDIHGQRPGMAAAGSSSAEERPQPWGARTGQAVDHLHAHGGDSREGTAKGRGSSDVHRLPVPGATREHAARPAAALPGGTDAVEALGWTTRPGGERAPEAAAASREVTLAGGDLERELPGLVVRQARLAGRGEEQELRVRVHPPELGEIRVTFRAREGELTGTVLAEREAVRGWLAAEAPAWREQLAAQGVRVSRIDVALMSDLDVGGDGHPQPWHGGAPSGRQAAGPDLALPADEPPAPTPREAAVGVNTATSSGSIDYLA